MTNQVSAENHGTRVSRVPWPGGKLFLVGGFYRTRKFSDFAVDAERADPPNAAFAFCLPEYSSALGSVFGEAVHELTMEKSSVLRQIETRVADRVLTTHVTAPSGEVVSNPPQLESLPYRLVFAKVVSFDLDGFAASCDAAAEQLTDAALERLIDYSGRISDAIGNVGQAGGQPFGWPVILIALEPVEIDFTSDGEPILPMIVAEKDKRNVVPYPPLDEDIRTKFDELMIRKRQEYDARRGHSRLS